MLSWDTSDGYIPIGGTYTVEKVDGYVDFYAIWDRQASFIVYIPAKISINQDTGIGSSELSADLNYFSEGDSLTITADSDFKLVSEDDSNVIIPFTLRTTEPGISGSIQSGGILATFQYNNVTAKTLTVILDELVTEIGNYIGDITFTVDFESS